jgi:hypothetical protein
MVSVTNGLRRALSVSVGLLSKPLRSPMDPALATSGEALCAMVALTCAMPARWASFVASACAWGGGRHKRDQSIPNGHLHRILGGSIERYVVDDRTDDNAAANKFADYVGHVGVVAPEPIDPAYDERVAGTKHVK